MMGHKEYSCFALGNPIALNKVRNQITNILTTHRNVVKWYTIWLCVLFSKHSAFKVLNHRRNLLSKPTFNSQANAPTEDLFDLQIGEHVDVEDLSRKAFQVVKWP